MLLVLTLLTGIKAPAFADSSPTEYQVKAAFVYNFAKFIDWPSGAFTDAKSAFVIGIVGDDPFGSNLEKVVEDKTIDGRNIVIRRYKKAADIQFCHTLFVSDSERDRLAKILDRVSRWSTLTIGDSDGFVARGGIINFVLEGKKVRFDINVDAADRADLKISSKLLQLARFVRRRS